jgi:prepilin-type processing-associated H-X9-DG protein
VALLLPAIQAAREAARRTDCINRIRQLALAGLSFESAKRRLPSNGEVWRGADGDWAGAMSVFARLLPYVEEQGVQNLVDQEVTWRHMNNWKALETPLPFLRCPSGKKVEFTSIGEYATGTAASENALRSHYVGIVGARPGPNKPVPAGVTAPPQTDGCSPPGGGRSWTFPHNTYTQFSCAKASNGAWPSGGTAINGAIICGRGVKVASVTDGMSKTMMFGEMSWDVGVQEVWIVGSTVTPADDSSYQLERAANGVPFNVKNVRYAINQKKYGYEDGTIPPSAVRDDPTSEYAPMTETSLGSYHPGGAHVVMCDGSAQFVSDDTDVEQVLHRMASRGSEDIYESNR